MKYIERLSVLSMDKILLQAPNKRKSKREKFFAPIITAQVLPKRSAENKKI